MKTTLALPLLAALSALGSLPGQEFVLLTRVGPGDLELNSTLVHAIANEPQVEAAVRAAIGDSLEEWKGMYVNIPETHAAGTFQVHFAMDLELDVPPNQETRTAIVDAARSHVEQRIRHLFYDQPLRQLTQRREQLVARLGKLMAKQAECADLAESVDQSGARLSQASELLDRQFVETRLELATEERAHDHLTTMREEYRVQREHLRKEGDQLHRQSLDLQDQIMTLGTRIQNLEKPQQLAADRKQLASLTDKVDQLEANRRDLAAAADDVQQLLASALERLPASSLALQRCKARLNSLEAERDAHQKRCEVAAQERTHSFAARVENEGLMIDIAVCKSLFAEVQGKLARLEPVHFEVLRPQ